ncbi:MAG: valine--tRNA ligase [Candidatus Dadabacteria bacterium]|nr:MAG: valine--tRNA ligase [Candidatus Dadabacteria bacterium]
MTGQSMSNTNGKIPKKYKHNDIEQKWSRLWEQNKIYRWDPSRPREETFVIDTPPPTVSGSLHLGHVFSYTQTDIIARYQRMRGKNIFYPMGWDDNGLPTERRVQNYFGIRCEPHLPYDPDWKPENHKRDERNILEVSRQNFIEACDYLTKIDEDAFERLWRRLGLSIDWEQQYSTIDNHCRKISQLSFLDLVKKGEVLHTESPTMWDVDFKSAIAQAEIEDREIPGAYHDIRFGVEGGGEFVISTTRPELLAACIAVVAHPDDERYRKYFGKTAITPLFNSPVPIAAAEHADPEKGTGILMVCTFGDIMDVEWWKQSSLPLKQIIDRNGKIMAVTHGQEPFISLNPDAANAAHKELQGLPVKKARQKIVELLKADGSAAGGNGVALVGDPKPITHPVKFYEKGERPLEFVPTRQWFVKILEHKEALLEQGRKVKWHPEHMFVRYQHWVEGLNQEWCYSRQRYFGVPFPVWYPVKDSGEPDYENPIFASPESLPVDPLSDVPPGYTEDQRDKPGGFSGDPDVMDTWSTSSLTPQIMSYWSIDPERHKKLFPSDLRPQAHEIIRTWAFYTIVKAWMHDQEIPWKHIAISGWVLDPDRKKMSKSKGNVVTPENLLEQYSSDAIRYWAGRARLGTDTACDPSVFKVGMRLATKIFNASRFVMMQFDRIGQSPADFSAELITEELDKAFVNRLRDLISKTTKNFEAFDYASALQATEDLFWQFCDHYLELVKARSYSEEASPERDSALATLALALKVFLKLFAPVLPYITEEVWSWGFAKNQNDSIHRSGWPSEEYTSPVEKPRHSFSFDNALEVITKIRAVKTEAQKTLKWQVAKLKIRAEEPVVEAIRPVLPDIMRAGNVLPDAVTLEAYPAEGNLTVEVTLADTPPA